MALKYGSTSPTAIKYNGTDLTVLKYGNTAVWGKPYSLSISQGSNTTVTVTRTSSPNQGASTGTLSSGSVVYYGDMLKITASANSGYNLSTFTVNGSGFTSGNTITVTSAISVVTTAVASVSWKTVWTGSNMLEYKYSDTPLNIVLSGFSNSLKANVPTKLTGYLYWYEEDSTYNSTKVNFTMNVGEYIYQNTTNATGSSSDISIGQLSTPPYTCYVYPYSVATNAIQISYRPAYYGAWYAITNYTITKIEQYY